MSRSLIPLLAAALAGFCLLPRPLSGEAAPPPSGGDAAPLIDDRNLKSTFEKELGKLMDEGKARPAAELLKELRGRTAHPLRLPAAPDTGTALPRSEIYRRSLESSLIFGHIYKCDKCSDWHGNFAGASILTADGIAATNFHVLDSPKAAAFAAMTAHGKIYPVAEILAASEPDDVAIVRLADAAGLTPLPLSTAAEPGDEVTVVSHPGGLFFTLTQGVVSRYSVLNPRPGQRPIPSLEITADYAAGSSGSPIFDSHGNVIGLVKSTRSLYYEQDKQGNQKNLQMVIKTCVPASSILRLLQPDPKPSTSANSAKPTGR